MKLIIVRDGSAILFSEFGEQPVKVGDLILLGANVLCASEPEDSITVTTIYVDTDYVLDQIFWQHAGLLGDRLATQEFADEMYSEPAQILHLGEHRAGMLMPWLDELVGLSLDDAPSERFHRMQALWFSVLDQVAPAVRISPVRESPSQRARIRPTLPRDRRFAPLREEARLARSAFEADPAHAWTLAEAADAVHLSPKQLVRVFVDAFGKTPLAYLTMLRVQEMAQRLRDTDITVAQAAKQAGWRSRSQASAAFKEHVGIAPGEYRARNRAGRRAISADAL